MQIAIDIEDDILKQFAKQLKSKRKANSLELDKSVGRGKIELVTYPNSLEFIHLTFCLREEIELASINPHKTNYYLLNINLSEKEVSKTINGKEVNFQKYLPTGILFYPADTKIVSKSPPDTNFEIVLIKFNKNLITSYFDSEENTFKKMSGSIVYEDLNAQSENLLRKIISSSNKLESHSNLLAFLSIFINKIRNREKNIKYENLHPTDIKQLFMAAALLRNPKPSQAPTIEGLSKIAKMGKTKFKNNFKQIFALPPMQYHQKIRMEYAMNSLLEKRKTSSEIAYELGYAHPSKFTRAFKNHFGEVPSKFS